MIELLFERRTLENPSTPLSDPDDWAYDAFGAGESSSGIRVSRETALTYSAVWRAVTLISSSVAKLPLFIYRRTNGGKERADAHPAYRLLRFNPNEEMNAFVFWQTLTGHVLLEGNAYAYIFRGGNAEPLELIPLLPNQTYPVRENGRLLYVTKVDTEWRKLLPENVLHIKGLGYDGLCGYSVIAKARDSFGLGLGAQRYQSMFFKNNARPSVVIEHPNSLKSEAIDELKRQWDKMHAGLENSHRTAVLTNGAKLNAFSINARDSQLLESRQHEIREIANWFGLPPHKLGDSSRTAYNSLEQENQSFLDDTLDPWLVAIEQECRDKLLTEAQKQSDSHVIEFMRQALVRADIVARYTAYRIGKESGFLNDNMIAAAENFNPLPDKIGTEYWMPLNMKVRNPTTGEPEDPAMLPEAPDLQAIVEAVIAKTLPPDAAEVIIAEAYPTMSPESITKLVKSAESFEPPTPEPVSTNGGKPPEDEPLPEEPPDDGDEPTDRSALTTAIRPLVETNIGRVARRLAKQITPAAAKPSKFLSVVDTAVLEFYDAFSDEAARHYTLCRAAGGPECDVRQGVSDGLGKLQDDLRALFASCQGDALSSAVESRMTDYELSISTLIANQLLPEQQI